MRYLRLIKRLQKTSLSYKSSKLQISRKHFYLHKFHKIEVSKVCCVYCIFKRKRVFSPVTSFTAQEKADGSISHKNLAITKMSYEIPD